MLKKIKTFAKYLKQTAHLMIGLPDYQAYVEHQKTHHSDQPIMTYEAFFCERQQARYAGNKRGCCC